MPGKSQQEKAREESGFRPASETSEAGVNQMSESSSSVSTDVQVGFSFLMKNVQREKFQISYMFGKNSLVTNGF